MLVHSQQIGQLLCISNASAKLSTFLLAWSGFQNPFSIFLHYSLKFSVFLCFSLFMAQKSNYIANGTRRWKRLRSVAVGRNDLWYKCRHVVMHSKSAPTGYRATLSESITGVCIASRRCACGVPTAIERVTALRSCTPAGPYVPSAILFLKKSIRTKSTHSVRRLGKTKTITKILIIR